MKGSGDPADILWTKIPQPEEIGFVDETTIGAYPEINVYTCLEFDARL